MQFEWDDEKADSNRRKHGITFEYATRVFLGPFAVEQEDISSDEERWITMGLVEEIVRFVVSTVREPRVRLISARKAEGYEREDHWNNRLRVEPR